MKSTTPAPALGIASALGLALLLAACSGPGASTSQETAAPVARPAPPVAAPAVAAAPVRPEGADAVDAALAAAKAFNAKSVEDLAGIARGEGRIRAAATRALDAARQRQAGRVAAARTEADAARSGLVAGLAAFRTDSAVQTAAVEAALALCAASPELTVYEGCVALPAEQMLLAQNITALTARYEAAETAWRQDRPRLDEASATVALGAIG